MVEGAHLKNVMSGGFVNVVDGKEVRGHGVGVNKKGPGEMGEGSR